jgi:hypothetical protein
MRYSPAQQRYNRRVLRLSLAYAALILPAAYVLKTVVIAGPLAVLVAVLPAIPLSGFFWMMGRYLMEETDEYVRMLQVQLLLIGTGLLLTAMVVWGLLEQFGLVPHIAAWWWPIVWVVGCAIGSCVQRLRMAK